MLSHSRVVSNGVVQKLLCLEALNKKVVITYFVQKRGILNFEIIMALFGTQCASENDRNEVDF